MGSEIKTSLKIGNILKRKGIDDLIYKVVEIGINQVTLDSIKGISDFGSVYYKDLELIELNEEWLIKAGFEKNRNGFALPDKLSLSFSITKNGEFLPCMNDRVLKQDFIIRYVHQLQNLYFALTGEELTIKLQ